MKIYILFYVLTLLVLVNSYGFNLLSPQSPCPKIFKYLYNGTNWAGIITIRSTTLPSNPIQLEAQFSIVNWKKPTKPFVTELKVIGSQSEVWKSMKSGGLINYKVEFPIMNSLPAVDKIVQNGKIICTRKPGLMYGPWMTTSTLKHTLESVPRSSSPIKPTVSPTIKTSVKPKNFDQCGLSKIGSWLMINGDLVAQGRYPWMAALFAQTDVGIDYKCGATLISNRHSISAAHCFKVGSKDLKAQNFILMLGKQKIRKMLEPGSLVLDVSKIILHPEYKVLSSDADIAIIFVSKPVQVSSTIYPICLPTPNALPELTGTFGTVVGWGRDSLERKMSNELQQVKMSVVSQETCLRSNKEFAYITSSRTFCAGGVLLETGPCSGDSGGGFMTLNNGKWYLRGIVSMSLVDPNNSFCDLKHYSVFVNVDKFVDWIQQQIR